MDEKTIEALLTSTPPNRSDLLELVLLNMTPTQERRYSLYSAGATLTAIALQDNVSVPTVKNSIIGAVKRVRKRLSLFDTSSIKEIKHNEHTTDSTRENQKTNFQRQILRLSIEAEYEKCCICLWARGAIDLAHVSSAKNGGIYSFDNITPLCPNHHRLFDKNLLFCEEKKKMGLFIKKISQMGLKEVNILIRERGHELSSRLCRKR